ncbi:MAG: LpxI family protein [Aquificae bacterium]|nr:LpxI family protein [Aquificota bacterium]
MKIGLIAGEGSLPEEFLKSAQKKNIQVVIFGIKGITDPSLGNYGKLVWVDFGKLQQLIDSLKKEKIQDLIMLGKIEHKTLLESISEFDQRALMFLSKLQDKRAVPILEGLIKEFEAEGFRFIDPMPFLEDILVKEGVLTKHKPDKKQLKDANFGLKIAKSIAELDIGQTVVVKDQIVIAVEAIEGTDRCILRGGSLGGEGTVVCKVARRNQDMRYDVPVIGIQTLKSMVEAKAKVLAVEAEKTYLIDKENFIKFADKNGITVIGIKLDESISKGN